MPGESDKGLVVPFSDDEVVRDDELITDGAAPAGETPEQRETRLEKRRARAKEREDERKEQRERLARVEGELQQERAARARLEGMVTRPAPAPGKDPYAEALDQVYAEQQESYRAYESELAAGGGKMPAERVKHYEGLSRQYETRKGQIHSEAAVARSRHEIRQESAQQVYVQKYPDVFGNSTSFEYAQTLSRQRQLRGERITPEVVEEIVNQTRVDLKMGGKPAPSKNERDKFSGTSSSGGGGGSSDTSGGIRMTADLRKMAIALHPELPEKEAIQKWADSAGKELRKAKVL